MGAGLNGQQPMSVFRCRMGDVAAKIRAALRSRVAARPPLIPPADPRRVARQLRVTGRSLLVISLLVAGWMAWTEWRRSEPTPEELIPGYADAERRQVGEMDGLFARDVWDVWSEVRRPYPAAAIITTSGVLAFWGLNRLARRHEAEA